MLRHGEVEGPCCGMTLLEHGEVEGPCCGMTLLEHEEVEGPCWSMEKLRALFVALRKREGPKDKEEHMLGHREMEGT
jgi:hypothetical protein